MLYFLIYTVSLLGAYHNNEWSAPKKNEAVHAIRSLMKTVSLFGGISGARSRTLERAVAK